MLSSYEEGFGWTSTLIWKSCDVTLFYLFHSISHVTIVNIIPKETLIIGKDQIKNIVQCMHSVMLLDQNKITLNLD